MYRRLLSFAKPHWGVFIIAAIGMAFYAATDTGFAWVIKQLLASIDKPVGESDPQAEMIRDPVCGTWIDRRLAVFGRRGGEMVPVCSDTCRRTLEAG